MWRLEAPLLDIASDCDDRLDDCRCRSRAEAGRGGRAQGESPSRRTGALAERRSFRRCAVDARTGADQPAHQRLSNREYEILLLLASGKPAKAIARDLSLSPQTISTHRARMLKKLGLQSTAELIRYAIQNRLVD